LYSIYHKKLKVFENNLYYTFPFVRQYRPTTPSPPLSLGYPFDGDFEIGSSKFKQHFTRYLIFLHEDLYFFSQVFYLEVGHHQPGCEISACQSQVAGRKSLKHRRVAATPPSLHKGETQGDNAVPVAPLNHVQLEANDFYITEFFLTQQLSTKLCTSLSYLRKRPWAGFERPVHVQCI
jgi:hypothetical protein